MELDMEFSFLEKRTTDDHKGYKSQSLLQKNGSHLLQFASAISGDFTFFLLLASSF